jgi:isochorismate synthase EntC
MNNESQNEWTSSEKPYINLWMDIFKEKLKMLTERNRETTEYDRENAFNFLMCRENQDMVYGLFNLHRSYIIEVCLHYFPQEKQKLMNYVQHNLDKFHDDTLTLDEKQPYRRFFLNHENQDIFLILYGKNADGIIKAYKEKLDLINHREEKEKERALQFKLNIIESKIREVNRPFDKLELYAKKLINKSNSKRIEEKKASLDLFESVLEKKINFKSKPKTKNKVKSLKRVYRK